MTRLLFWLNVLLAAGLVALVLLAPLADAGHSQMLPLFARDGTVRQTALASAIGLVVTAWVFFRSTAAPAPDVKAPRLPPSNVIGA